MALRAATEDDLVKWGPQHMEELLGLWEELLAEVGQRQADYDANMTRNYTRQRGLARVDVHFEFTPGQQVIMWAKPAGKLRVHAKGPYQFVRYVGSSHTMIEVAGGDGRSKVVSCTHLRPMMAEQSPRFHRYPLPAVPLLPEP